MMKYIDLRRQMNSFTVFSLSDIRRSDPSFHRRRLNEWQDKGYIRKVIRGYYVFADLALNENVLYEIANRIYAPSYVSFETALYHYGLIPETVYGITSAATRKTRLFKSDVASFSYRTLKSRLFFGYRIMRYGSGVFKIAEPEKALLDVFYMNTRFETSDDIKSLRLNEKKLLEIVNRRKLSAYLKVFGQKTLNERVKPLLERLKHA